MGQKTKRILARACAVPSSRQVLDLAILIVKGLYDSIDDSGGSVIIVGEEIGLGLGQDLVQVIQ